MADMIAFMNVARDAAPEIDRLVWSVNRRMEAVHGGELLALARERGLDSLELLSNFADFLLAGTLSPELAILRMRYLPSGRVHRRLEELEGKHLIEHRGANLAATPAMVELLNGMYVARARVAADAWHDHIDEVATATHLAQAINLAASADHVVAAAHRVLPQPDDPYLRLHHCLVTLRYVRQHDHAEAWLSQGLTAPAIVAMTQLWHGNAVEASDDGLAQLVTLGFATAEPPALTAAGSTTRNAIEADTDRRAQASFAVLGDQEAVEFVQTLRNLPGTVA